MLEEGRLVIQGVKEDGSELRPADWMERISSSLSQFSQDQSLQYRSCVKPCIIDGHKCLVIARCLEQHYPAAYAFIMDFARSNHLRIQPDRRTGDRALVCSEIEKE